MLEYRTEATSFELFTLAAEYCKEFKFDTDAVTLNSYVAWIMGQTNIVAYMDGRAVGIISYLTYKHHLTGKLVGKKVAWFVLKEHRGKIGYDLLGQAEIKCKELGAEKFYCSTPTKMPKAYTSIETEYERIL